MYKGTCTLHNAIHSRQAGVGPGVGVGVGVDTKTPTPGVGVDSDENPIDSAALLSEASKSRRRGQQSNKFTAQAS